MARTRQALTTEVGRALQAYQRSTQAFDDEVGRILGLNPTDLRSIVGDTVAEAVAGDPWFAEHSPRITWDGFQSAGSTVSMDEPSVQLLNRS